MLAPRLALTSLLLLTASALPAETLNIIYMGDSITAGAGLRLAQGDIAPPAACSAALRKAGNEVYDSNQGHSGHTTKDFLPPQAPNPKSDFEKAEAAAKQLATAHPAPVLFSVMIGTNDSAEHGPNGAPLPPDGYHHNLQATIDRLLADFPQSRVVLHHPTWYSPTTHNSSLYGPKGLARLKSYDPVLESLAQEYAKTAPGRVFVGDREAFAYFETHFAEVFREEKGGDGIFYLHPNQAGAVRLGEFWAAAMLRVLGSVR